MNSHTLGYPVDSDSSQDAAVRLKPVRVLQLICPTGFYGAERWVLALLNNLDSQVVHSVLAMTREPGQQLPDLAGQHEGDTLALSMRGPFDLSVVGDLADQLRSLNIDILHTHGYKSDIIGLLAARRAGIKCISTPHGYENSKALKLRSYVWLGKLALRFFDKVVPLSTEITEEVASAGIHRSKIVKITNGVDLGELELARQLHPHSGGNDTNCKVIGFVGQMIARKNVTDILHIFSDLKKTHCNVKLVLLGDGVEKPALEACAAEMDCADDIQFLGYRDDRLAYLRRFDLFVMTSAYEGIPRCLMEAMAMGVPVAAYDIPGVAQLVSHQRTGLLADPGDRRRMLEHWESLLYDRVEARRLAEAAREFIERHYSAQRVATEYTRLFHQLTDH